MNCLDNDRSDSECNDAESESVSTISISCQDEADLKLEEKKDNQGVSDISQCSRNVSLMSTSEEEPVHDDARWKVQTLVQSNGTMMLLNRNIQILQADLDTVYRQMREQQEMRDYLKNELDVLMKASMNSEMVYKEEAENLMKLIEDRNTEIKELWSMIQKLGDTNVELKNQSKKSTRIEKEMTNKIINLKVSIPNGKPEDMFVSKTTINWKKKMRQDQSRSQKLSDRRKREKLLNKKFNERLRLEDTRNVNNSLKFVQNKQKSSYKSKYVSKIQHDDRFGMKHTGSVKSTDGTKVDKALVIRKGF